MSTPNRTLINKQNAQHSTGPKTEAGKKQSSLNALRHGLTGQIVVMPTEDLQAYQQHLKSFTDDLNPKGVIEASLVQALADTSWRLNRVAALETNLLTSGMVHPSPFPGAEQQIQDPLSIVAALESALQPEHAHSQRLSRQFERTVIQLRDLQRTRRAQEKQDVSDLVDVVKMYEDKEIPYDPSEDGFVFSQTQIDEGILACNREELLEAAYEHRLESAD